MDRIIRSVLIVAAMFSTLFVCGCGHPSDESVIRRFNKNKAPYEQLSVMASQDKHLWRIARTWYRTASGANLNEAKNDLLSNDRWKEYRILFGKLGLKDGIDIQDGNVYFPVSSMGIVGSGSSKGIAFISLKDKAQSSSINSPHGVTYKHIDGNWYLFEDW